MPRSHRTTNTIPGKRLVTTTLLAIACIVLLIPFVLPFWLLGAGWWDEAGDIAHFVSFGLIALALHRGSTIWLKGERTRLGFLLVSIFLLASVTELVQYLVHADRQGSVNDVLRNCLGAICFLTIVYALKRKMGVRFSKLSFLSLIVGMSIAAVAVLPAWQRWNTAKLKQARLPIIFDAFKDQELNELSWANAEPEAGPNGNGPTVFVYPNDNSGGIRINRVPSNWANYTKLSLDLQVEMDVNALPLTIYVVYTNNLMQKKANWGVANFNLRKGENKVTVPLENFVYGGEKVDFENARVKFVDLSQNHRDQGLRLSLDQIKLLK